VSEGTSKEEIDFEAMTVGQLKRELRLRDLATNGRKQELITRLYKFGQQEPSVSEEEAAVECEGDRLPTEAPITKTSTISTVIEEACAEEQDPEKAETPDACEDEEAESDSKAQANRSLEAEETGTPEVQGQDAEESPESDGDGDEGASEELVDLEILKVEELRRELKRRELPTNGRKLDLIRRLRDYIEHVGQTNLSQSAPVDTPLAEEVESAPVETEETHDVPSAAESQIEEAVEEDSGTEDGGEGLEAEVTVEVKFIEERREPEVEELEEGEVESRTVDLERMTVAALKQELKKRGLPCTGRKLDLIKRLRDSNTIRSGSAEQAKPQLVQMAIEKDVRGSSATPYRSLVLTTTPKTPRGRSLGPKKNVPWPPMPEIEALEHEELIVEIKEDSFEIPADNHDDVDAPEPGKPSAAMSFRAPPVELSMVDVSLVGASAISMSTARPRQSNAFDAQEYSFMANKRSLGQHTEELLSASLLDISEIHAETEGEGDLGDADTTVIRGKRISERTDDSSFKKPQGRALRVSTAKRTSQADIVSTTTTPTKSPKPRQASPSPILFSSDTSASPKSAATATTTPTKSPQSERPATPTSRSPSPAGKSKTPSPKSPQLTQGSARRSPYSFSVAATPAYISPARTPSVSTVQRRRISTFWPELPALDRYTIMCQRWTCNC
jgi:hypothetical protein